MKTEKMKNLRLNYAWMLLLLGVMLIWSCGGRDEEMEEVLESCSDGIQNQDEAGIDCGGVCGGMCGVPNSGYYFYGVIDGEEVVISGMNSGGVGLSHCSGSIDTYTNTGAWWLDINLPESAQVVLYKNLLSPPSTMDYYNMLVEGSYSYRAESAVSDCMDVAAYAYIGWIDKGGTVWWSSKGDQTGSEFTITNRGSVVGLNADIEGTFTCKLYSEAGEVKTVESGEFRFRAYL